MHKNAKDYGIDNIEIDPPLIYETVDITAPTHLALVADAADRPVSELRELNPALLTNVAPSGYSLRVPQGTKPMVLAGLENIPLERRASWRIHRVALGDTLESIARQYKMPVSAITAANSAVDPELGDVLVIPTATQLERARLAGRKTKSTPARSKPALQRLATRHSDTSSSFR